MLIPLNHFLQLHIFQFVFTFRPSFKPRRF